MKHGEGCYFYNNGDIYLGNWYNNRKDGFGVHYYDCGFIYKGFWKNSKK